MSDVKTIKIVAEEVKYVLCGQDSYMCMMVDLTDDVDKDILSDENCVEVHYNSQTVSELCKMHAEYGFAVLDFVKR